MLRPGPALALALSAGLVTGCAGHPADPSTTTRPSGSALPSRLASAAPAPTNPAPVSPAPIAPASPTAATAAPGTDAALPQTLASPLATTPGFDQEAALLWQAVRTGDPAAAGPAFFPLPAYRQVKAVRDPSADWQDRLWADFALDVAAAHRLVATDPSATLDRVDVPAGQAAWIAPGRCANRVGYWHVAGARLVYRTAAGPRSFGVASLISWRGNWYVVHLGAVTRTSHVGVVDRPTTGPGVPGPAGGC